MVKPQSSCFESFAARPDAAVGIANGVEPMRVIPSGDQNHIGSFLLAKRWAGALRPKLNSGGVAWVMAIASATAISTATPALSAGLGNWSYSPATGAIEFALDSAAQPEYFLMANPMRIVVDLPGTSANLAALEAQSGGVFTNIRGAQTQAGKTRLVLQLAPGTVLQPGQVELTALGGGRWSIQPLLAEGAEPRLEPQVESGTEPEFMPEGAPVVTVLPGSELPSLTEPVEEPEFALPSLEAMEAAAVAQDEFVSMEETLERQAFLGNAPAPVAVPQGVVPVGDSAEGNTAVAWGSSQLPPVPTNFAPTDFAPTSFAPTNFAAPAMAQPDSAGIAAAPQAPVSPAPAVLPQLPQPRLGQAPFAFNPPLSAALVDPAQIVDTSQLRRSDAALSPRPPAPVEPVIDPKLLSLDEQQSAAALGGQTGLVLNRGVAPAVRRSVAPAPAVPLPVVAQPDVADGSVPFLVEFGAPLPGVGP